MVKFRELGFKISLTSRLWKSANHFFPLGIEVFGCLNKQADVFLHDSVNAMWNFKKSKGFPLSVLFFYQKISILLQRMQVYFILRWVVTLGLATSWLPPFKTHPTSTWLTSYKQLVVETERFRHLVCVSITSNKLILLIFFYIKFFLWCVY